MSEKLERFLQEFNAAFERGDIAFIVDHVTDDIRWEMVGDSLVEGKEALRQVMWAANEGRLPKLTIESTVIDGSRAAVTGTMTMPDRSGAVKSYGFCDVYEMGGPHSDKVRGLKGFVIELEAG